MNQHLSERSQAVRTAPVASERGFAPRGIAELQEALHGLREELRKVDNDLQAAHEVAEEAEERWTEHYDAICEQLEDEAEGRLPGEELRISIARRRGGAVAWTNHRRAERLVKKLEKRATLIRDRISAAQSEAKLQGAGDES